MKIRHLFAPLALAATLLSCRGAESTPSASDETDEKVARVQLLELESERIVDYSVLSADLRPRRRAVLAAEVAGVVEELHVELGERVSRDELIGRIDTRALQQQLAEVEALYQRALDRAERAEALFARRSITEQARLDAIADRDVTAARLGATRLALEKSEIRAPWAGRVAAKRIEVGDYAVPGQPVLELVDVARIVVGANAPSSDVPFLELGLPVTVRLDVFPGETFEGQVVRLGAELDPDSRTLEVEAELANPDGRLRPGLFARLEIPRRTLEGAVAVPLTSVVDFENHKVIYVVEGDRARRREVRLGPIVGERVVIEEGLEAGARVIVRGQRQVAEGQRVMEAEG